MTSAKTAAGRCSARHRTARLRSRRSGWRTGRWLSWPATCRPFGAQAVHGPSAEAEPPRAPPRPKATGLSTVDALASRSTRRPAPFPASKVKGIAARLGRRKVELRTERLLATCRQEPGRREAVRAGEDYGQGSGALVASLLGSNRTPRLPAVCRELVAVMRRSRSTCRSSTSIDKEKVRTKEGVHFAFPFNVPDGVMRMDIPWAVVRPEEDQIAGGVQELVHRAALGGRVERQVRRHLGDASTPRWSRSARSRPKRRGSETLEPSQTLFSYVMNNYWHTNYKADQEGDVMFRYSLRPHAGRYRAIDAARFGYRREQSAVRRARQARRPRRNPFAFEARAGRRGDCHAQAERRPAGDHRAAVQSRREGGQGDAGVVRPAAHQDLPEQPGRRPRAKRSPARSTCPAWDWLPCGRSCREAEGYSSRGAGCQPAKTTRGWQPAPRCDGK